MVIIREQLVGLLSSWDLSRSVEYQGVLKTVRQWRQNTQLNKTTTDSFNK